MIENGHAKSILGNHEYNAICFATLNPLKNGEYLRVHNKSNIEHHKAFLKDYPLGSQKHKDVIKWFKTLPLFADLGVLRLVHAVWKKESICFLKNNLKNNVLDDDFIIRSCVKGSDEFIHLETTLKGIELRLPDNKVWVDPHGTERNTFRFNWYQENEINNYQKCALSFPNVNLLPNCKIKNKPETYQDNIPVLFGHYWLTGNPSIQTDYAACLDYSVAKKGQLVACVFFS